LSRAALEATDAIVAVGAEARRTVKDYCDALDLRPPPMTEAPADDEVLIWGRFSSTSPAIVKVEGPAREHQRHIRKYAQGELGEDKSFYFRGPKGVLKLRAQNLTIFLQMAAGVDDETWLFHLH